MKFEIFNALPNKQQKPLSKICDDFLSFKLFYAGFSPLLCVMIILCCKITYEKFNVAFPLFLEVIFCN